MIPMAAMAETAGPGGRCKILAEDFRQAGFDVRAVHDSFVSFLTDSDVWIKSAYLGNKYVHCVCLKEYKPTTVKLGRGDNSYIIGTITLHALDAPAIDS